MHLLKNNVLGWLNRISRVAHGRRVNVMVIIQKPMSFLPSLNLLLDSIYCIPLQSPASMIKELKVSAIKMDPFVKDILIKHPLVTIRVL